MKSIPLEKPVTLLVCLSSAAGLANTAILGVETHRTQECPIFYCTKKSITVLTTAF
jgi:hypothetical protein